MGRRCRLAFVCLVSIFVLVLNIIVGGASRHLIVLYLPNSKRVQDSEQPPQPLNASIPFLPRVEDKRKLHFPPLEDLLGNATNSESIVGDTSFLLDVGILGHPKCATSFLMRWLSGHSQVRMWKQEVCHLMEPATLAEKLYHDFPPETSTTQRGFKCPGRFARSTLLNLRRHFRRARLIVGVRHPVKWFESYYNFRNRHPRSPSPLPDADELIGKCVAEGQGVCTSRGAFHQNLAMFGKTNVSAEQEWLHLPEKYERSSPIDNLVFLYDVAQLYDSNASRVDRFKLDLQHFLGLEEPLVDATDIPIKEDHRKVARMDICESRYAGLRRELLEIGTLGGEWIRRFFLASPTVYVSDRENFEGILEEWKIDPCTNATASVA